MSAERCAECGYKRVAAIHDADMIGKLAPNGESYHPFVSPQPEGEAAPPLCNYCEFPMKPVRGGWECFQRGCGRGSRMVDAPRPSEGAPTVERLCADCDSPKECALRILVEREQNVCHRRPASEAPAEPSALADGWERIGLRECVECPRCGFEFSSLHADDVPHGVRYSCPACGEREAAASHTALLDAARQAEREARVATQRLTLVLSLRITDPAWESWDIAEAHHRLHKRRDQMWQIWTAHRALKSTLATLRALTSTETPSNG